MVADLRVTVSDIPNLDPPAYYSRLGACGGYPTIRLPSGHEAVHLTSYQDVQKAMTNPAFSRALANLVGGPSFYPIVLPSTLLLTLDPPHHGQVKKLVSARFGANVIENLRPSVVKTVDRLLTELAASGPGADLVSSLTQPLASAVICEILGVPLEDSALFERRAVEIQTMGWGGASRPAESVDAMVAYLLELVVGGRPSEDGGLVRHVLAAKAAGAEITDEEIVGLLLLIVVAGDQSVVSILTKGLYILLCAPRLWRRLIEAPNHIPGVVEEFLRLMPLGYIPALPRVATKDVPLSRGVIPAGQPIFPDGFLANRDPSTFAHPKVIDSRRTVRHLGLGYGIHHCLGGAVARMEMAEALRGLVDRFPGLHAAFQPNELEWRQGWLVRRPRRLPAAW